MSVQLLTLAEAARRVGVCQRTLRRHRGELPIVRVGRRRLVSAADLDVWVAQRSAVVPIVTPPRTVSDAAKRLLGRLERAQMVRSGAQPRDNTRPDPLTACQARGQNG